MFKQYLAKQTFLLEYRGLYLTRKHTGLYYMKPEKKKKGIENYLVRFMKSCCLVWHLIKMMNLNFLEIEEILYN